MENPTIGDIIRRERERRRMSLNELARISGVPVATVSDIERGHVDEPSIVKVARLCSAIGITVDQVLEEAGLVPSTAERRADAPATQADIAELNARIDEMRRLLEERLPTDDCGDDAADDDGTHGPSRAPR